MNAATTTALPRAVVPPAPPSPLRSVQEVQGGDMTLAMAEDFDGEFLDMGGESFFDIVDEENG